eukprot:390507_1
MCFLLETTIITLLITISVSQIQQPCYYYEKTLPFNISNHQMVYFKDLNVVYLFGGYNGVYSSNAVYKWNLSDTSSWFERIEQKYEVRSEINNVVTINNLAYFSGVEGNYYRSNIQPPIRVFDGVTESLKYIMTAPKIPSQYGCLSTNTTHIFMVGGQTGKDAYDYTNKLQIYDINRNQWSSQAIDIFAQYDEGFRYGFSNQYCPNVLVNDLLYVFGGLSVKPSLNSTCCNQRFQYNSSNDEWTYLGPLTLSNSAMNGITVYDESNSRMYIIGGYRGDDFYEARRIGNATSDILSINSVTGETEKIYKMIDAVLNTAALIINKKIYIFGGRLKGKPSTISNLVQVCEVN